MAPHGGTITVPRLPGNINEIWAAFKCDNCSALTVAMATARAGDGAILSDPAGWLGRMNHTQWYPVHSVGKDFPDVPQHIADAASEAYRCRSISALRTAVQLARSVVEATAKERELPKEASSVRSTKCTTKDSYESISRTVRTKFAISEMIWRMATLFHL